MTNPPSEAAKLLPCPFCGKRVTCREKIIPFSAFNPNPSLTFMIFCDCGCAKVEGSPKSTVVKFWNTRAHDAEIRREAFENLKSTLYLKFNNAWANSVDLDDVLDTISLLIPKPSNLPPPPPPPPPPRQIREGVCVITKPSKEVKS